MPHQRNRTIGELLDMVSFFYKHPVIPPHPLLQRVRQPTVIENGPNSDNFDCDRRCLCDCISPVFRLCQLFGIAPGRFVHTPSTHIQTLTTVALNQNEYVAVNLGRSFLQYPQPTTSEKSSCLLQVKWFSIPCAINLIFIISFITITAWVSQNVSMVLKIYFYGTDLYTFGLQVQLLYLQACGVLLNAILKRRKLQRVWHLIQDVYRDKACAGKSVNNKAFIQQKFSQLKKINYCLVSITCCTGALFATYFVHFVFRWCFYDVSDAVEEMRSENRGVGGQSDFELLKVKPPCPFSDGFLLLQKVAYAILIFYNMGFASLFWGLCAIIWLLFKDISLRLGEVLFVNPREENDNAWAKYPDHSTETTFMRVSKAEQLEMLRIAHENLSKASRVLGDCFGISLLIVCVSSLLSITCAIYTGALRMGVFNTSPEQTRPFSTVSGFYVLSTVHGFVAVLVLLLILGSGQIVQNIASKPAEIIGKASHLHLNAEEKHQISIFLHKVGASSTKIRACSVTTIGLSFLAAAATNVTTYILVILQFRLGVEPQVEADEQQHQPN